MEAVMAASINSGGGYCGSDGDSYSGSNGGLRQRLQRPGGGGKQQQR